MEFRILGPLEVWDADRRLEIDAPKQRALLAILILHANQVVSTDRLLDLVWGEEQPESGVRTLRYHISKLRDTLQPGRDQGEEGVIATRSPGYVLVVDPDAVDAHRFERLSHESRRVLAEEPQRATSLIDDALGLWRGPPLGDFAYEEFARQEIIRLEELRQRAVEDRIDAALALGRHRDLIGELKAMTAKEPHRDRPWGQLMVALYRSGRQAEALDVFQQLRAQLGERGLEPSDELEALEERILLQDPSLLETGAPPEVDRLRGYALREKLGEGAFGVVWRAAQRGLGREVAIKAIRPELANLPEFVRRFETEAQLVAALEHPHIVSLFDFWRDPDGAYLVMPYLRGGSLGQAMSAGHFDRAAAMTIIEDVGAALSYSHRRGVVHQDVSPENVLLDEDGNAYLSDLGVSVLVGTRGLPPTASPAYASPERMEGGPATKQSDVYSLGLLAFSVLTGTTPEAGAPVPSVAHLDQELPAAIDDVIARATEREPGDRYPDVDALVRALQAALGAVAAPTVAGDEVRNPYKGLRAFGENDAADFFGRELLVSELVEAVGRHRLVGVVGPSGCGKSSLVRAGLIPAIRRGALPAPGGWLVADMYPGSRPFVELEEALLRVAVERSTDLADRLREPAFDAGATVAGLLPDGAHLLLIIDQFEELFTQTPDDTTRRTFLDLLTRFANDGNDRLRLVVTMRADFFDRPLEYPEFGELLRNGLVSLTTPSAENLALAIAKPACAVGLTLEGGLESEIVRDVSDRAGGLPLMEYALTELFHHRQDGQLTREAYRSTGGVLGALGRKAEELYGGYDAAGRAACRQVFLRLVAVEEGTADTRRRIPLTELHGLGVDRTVLDAVVDEFGRHRLLTFDRDPDTRAPTVEVAHEALLERWDRLRGWIDDRRDDLVLHRHLAASVGEWEDSGREPAYLLTGGRLEHYERFGVETDLALTDDERAFLAASRSRDDESAARRRRQRLAVLAGFAVAAVIALLLAVVALISRQDAQDNAAEADLQAEVAAANEREAVLQKDAAQQQARIAEEQTRLAEEQGNEAERQADLARSRELAASAIGALDDDPELSLLLALEAAKGDEPIFESVTALHEALLAHRVSLRVDVDEGLLSPTGEWFAASPTRSTVAVYDAATGESIWNASLPFPYIVGAGHFTPSGDRYVIRVGASAEDWDAAGESFVVLPQHPTVVMFDTETGAWEAPALDAACGLDDLIPDGHGWIHLDRPILARSRLLEDGECVDRTILVVGVDLAQRTLVERARFDSAEISFGSWSTDDDGRFLALGVRNRTTVIDLETGERRQYGPRTRYGDSNALNGDASLVVTMGVPSIVWDRSEDRAVATFDSEIGAERAWFSADETQLITATGVWDIETSDLVVAFGEPGTGSWSMSADGMLGLTSSFMGTALWNLGVQGEVTAVDLVPTGYHSRSLAVGGGRGAIVRAPDGVFGRVVVFDLTTGAILHEFRDAAGAAAALSPDGRFLAIPEEAASNVLGSVRVHDLQTGDVVRMGGVCPWNNDLGPGPECAPFPAAPFATWVVALEFSPDGSRLVASIRTAEHSEEEIEWRPAVVVWDTATGGILRTKQGFPFASLVPNTETLVLVEGEFALVGDLDGGPATEHDVDGLYLNYSADGSMVAAGQGGFGLYDTATWSELRYVDTDSRCKDWALSPTASQAAAGCDDGVVRVYDAGSGELLQAIPIGGELTNVAFVGENRLLAIPRSGPGYVVTTDVDELLALAHVRVTRDLTAEECATYRIEPCPSLESEDGE